MKAEIIPIGTEILLGNIVDTNSSFLANQLSSLGIDLYFVSIVGDNQERLIDTLKRAWNRADLIITTGGLGPTEDDITRQAIAELLGEELSVDQKLWQELQDLLSQHRWKVPQSNIRQAWVIPSAEVIPNPIGTAPGWWIEKDEHIMVVMPGPPDELSLMWKESVLPKLQQRATGAVLLSKTIKTFGLAEAKVGELVTPFLQLSNPTLATYVKPDGIHLRITSKAKEQAEAERMIAQREAEIKNVLAPHIWGVDEDVLESVIITLLKVRNLSLATMESCTQGLLCSTITNSPESLTCFKGGLVACSDEAKVAFGIDARIVERYGEESSQVAEAMAGAARKKLKADIGIGIAGTMNLPQKTGNIFIGLNSDKSEQVIARTFLGSEARIKQRAVYTALFKLRRILLEEVRCT